MIFLWFWHSFRHSMYIILMFATNILDIYASILTDREMVLLMLNQCSIRSCDSLPIVHTMIASDGECTVNGYIPQVPKQLESMYPDGSPQYYRPTNE